MQDLTQFVRHSDEQVTGQLDGQAGKYASFDVMWNNVRYQVHYVLSKSGKSGWKMMAYARMD